MLSENKTRAMFIANLMLAYHLPNCRLDIFFLIYKCKLNVIIISVIFFLGATVATDSLSF